MSEWFYWLGGIAMWSVAIIQGRELWRRKSSTTCECTPCGVESLAAEHGVTALQAQCALDAGVATTIQRIAEMKAQP